MSSNLVAYARLMIAILLCCNFAVSAQDPVPCLIFSGSSDSEKCLDLAKNNRIYFNSDGMRVSPGQSGDGEDIFLAYSDFKTFRVGLGVPKTPSGIDKIDADSTSQLIYLSETDEIVIESDSESAFHINIYGLEGSLKVTAEIHAGQRLYVGNLPQGMYIASAIGSNTNLTLKFIKK